MDTRNIAVNKIELGWLILISSYYCSEARRKTLLSSEVYCVIALQFVIIKLRCVPVDEYVLRVIRRITPYCLVKVLSSSDQVCTVHYCSLRFCSWRNRLRPFTYFAPSSHLTEIKKYSSSGRIETLPNKIYFWLPKKFGYTGSRTRSLPKKLLSSLWTWCHP